MINSEYNQIEKYIGKVLENETRLLVSDFAILWNKYENYIFNNNYNPRSINEKVLEKIKKDNNFEIKVNSLYESFCEYLQYKKIKFNTHDIIIEFSIRENDISVEELNFMINSDEYKDKLKLLLIIIGRVRNNMFHGIKLIIDLNTQKELFRISNQILFLVLMNRNLSDFY